MDRTDSVLGGILVTILAAFILQEAYFGGTGVGAIIAGPFFGTNPTPDADQPALLEPSRPDLITAFAAARIDGKPIELKDETVRVPLGLTVTLVERLWNNGSALAASSYSRVIWGDLTEAAYRPPLSPGQYVLSDVDFACASTGIYYFASGADFDNRILESNEGNNGAFATVACG